DDVPAFSVREGAGDSLSGRDGDVADHTAVVAGRAGKRPAGQSCLGDRVTAGEYNAGVRPRVRKRGHEVVVEREARAAEAAARRESEVLRVACSPLFGHDDVPALSVRERARDGLSG